MSKVEQRALSAAWAYGLGATACAVTTAVATPLRDLLDLANIVMLFLLTVFLVALRLGRGPAILAAFLSVALFDVFFVPPRLSFAVSDVQFVVTFAVMLAVGLVTTQLTAGLRRQAAIATGREREAQGLYALAREIAGAVRLDQVREALDRYLADVGLRAKLHLLDRAGEFASLHDNAAAATLARTAIQSGAPVPAEAIDDVSEPGLLLPLKAPMRIRGVMWLRPEAGQAEPDDADRDRLMTVASLVAIAVERLHYVEVAQETQVEAASERLRSSVLSALSHDLRTPLTALVGLADALALTREPRAEEAHELAAAIRDQARALSNLVGNLLDMARLHAGRVSLRKEWQLFEDVIGAALQLLKPVLGGRRVQVELATDLPLVEIDAVLLERVLCNLLENAAKYSPAESAIEVRAFVERGDACIAVCDRGSGFAPDKLTRVFEMFVRGAAESPTPGVGLGLAIAKTIVEAHGGSIAAANREGGGACVTLRLPLGTPPAIDEAAVAA